MGRGGWRDVERGEEQKGRRDSGEEDSRRHTAVKGQTVVGAGRVWFLGETWIVQYRNPAVETSSSSSVLAGGDQSQVFGVNGRV